MTTLADLFDGERETLSMVDSASMSDGLADLFAQGNAYDESDSGGGAVADPMDLSQLFTVEKLDQSEVAFTGPLSSNPVSQPPISARSGSRRWPIVMGAIGIAVVAGTLVVAGAAAFGSRPGDGAIKTLTVQEGALADAQESLSTSVDRTETAIAALRTEIDSFDGALVALANSVDEAARQGGLAAVASARSGLDQIVIPVELARYARPPEVDASSMESIGLAVDEVSATSLLVSAQSEEAREARKAVIEVEDAVLAAATQFGVTLSASAIGINEENSLADQALRDALTASADAVIADQQAGRLGAGEMLAYVAAVQALRSAQASAVEAERIAEELRQEQLRLQTIQPTPAPVYRAPVRTVPTVPAPAPTVGVPTPVPTPVEPPPTVTPPDEGSAPSVVPGEVVPAPVATP